MLILYRTVRERGGGGRDGGGRQSEGLGGVVWVYKINRSQMTSHYNGNHPKISVSLFARGRQRTGIRALKLYFTRIVV